MRLSTFERAKDTEICFNYSYQLDNRFCRSLLTYFDDFQVGAYCYRFVYKLRDIEVTKEINFSYLLLSASWGQ